jgi:hypothetical protein
LLPPSPSLPFPPLPPSPLSPVLGACSTASYFRKGRTTIIRHTIRKRIDDLTEKCELVKNQRDELQKALLQREKDINALMK